MRVSKPPEERKQEMIDTAMKVFSRKGYASTTMTDIAKEMNVVPGLCYRYFKSKEELYDVALDLYAEQCSLPMIQVFEQEFDSLEAYFNVMSNIFIEHDGKEKYHDFFHAEGNELFHRQLELKIVNRMAPYVIDLLEKMSEKGIVQLEHIRETVLFMLHGELSIINDETLTSKEKSEIIVSLMRKLLLPK